MTGYRLLVRVEIRDREYGGQGLTVAEEVDLSLDGFLEVSQVLGRFHELTAAVKADKAAQAAEREAVMRGQ